MGNFFGDFSQRGQPRCEHRDGRSQIRCHLDRHGRRRKPMEMAFQHIFGIQKLTIAQMNPLAFIRGLVAVLKIFKQPKHSCSLLANYADLPPVESGVDTQNVLKHVNFACCHLF